MKNRTFKDIHDNKKTFHKNQLNLIEFYKNWNNEYKKVDEISTKNCLTIDKYITRRKIKNIGTKQIKKYNSTEYCKESAFSYDEQKNRLNKNIFTNKTINKKINSNLVYIEPKIYCKTIESRNNNRYEEDKSENNQTIRKTYQNIFTQVSSKNNKSIGVSKTQYRNNFKLFSNFFNQNNNSQKNDEESNNKKFLKTYLLDKANKQIKIKNNKSEDKTKISLNLKRINDIREKENPRVNINAYRLYERIIKNKNKKENNEIYNKDLLVEKYNQIKQSNIIRKIIEKQNKIFLKSKKDNNKVKSD